jgi:hypothetical protein
MFTLEPAKSHWAVQILTLDYLIEGQLDADRDRYAFRLLGHDVSPLPVVSARLRPTGSLALATPKIVPRVLVYGDCLVALVPRDQASLASAMQTNATFKQAIPAAAYVGPYVIHGQVLSLDSSLRVFEGYNGFPVQAAEIKCLIPGSPLTDLTAPYVLVLSRHKQALVPLA